MHAIIARNRERWRNDRKEAADPKENHLELHRRYLDIRRDIVSELRAEHAREYPDEYLSDELDYSEFTFIFGTKHGGFCNSHVNTLGRYFANILRLSAGQRVIDLGTGFGEQGFTAALFGATVVGLEINPYLYQSGLILRDVFGDLPGIASVDLKQGDLFVEDISGFDVYLLFFAKDLLEPTVRRVTDQAGKGAILAFPGTAPRMPDCWRFDDRSQAYVRQG
jgi:SAM-dependent methyltransferase